MKRALTILTLPLAAFPLAAQAHPGHPPGPTATTPAENPDTAAVRAVLAQYHSALERLDAGGTEKLFAPDSAIFETGGREGTYANYLAHHLGPELAEFKSFKFSDYKVDIRLEGPLALATESYKYRIETKDGTVVERLGVSTSVLKKIGGEWKILISHNSGRKPKGT